MLIELHVFKFFLISDFINTIIIIYIIHRLFILCGSR